MLYRKINILLVFIYIKIRILSAEVPNTSSNQGAQSSSVQPRFVEPGSMGFPNFGSGRFGSPTSNYPVNSFFPFGNQNQYPNQGNFENSPNQGGFSNQQRFPYQGDSMNPNPNYQRPSYSSIQNNVGMYPNQNPNQGNIQVRPNQGGYPNLGYPYQGDSMNPYPNYQQPSYPDNNSPTDTIMYPGQYQNRGLPSDQGTPFYRPMPRQGFPSRSFQYPQQDGQYPSQRNFQGNPNMAPGESNSNFHPDDINNFPDWNMQFPDSPYLQQPNQYYPPINSNQNTGRQNNVLPNPANNIRGNDIQFPTDSPYANGEQAIQFPGSTKPDVPVYDDAKSTINPGKLNNIPSNNSKIHAIPNNNDTVAIWKPVIVPTTTMSPGQVVPFDKRAKRASQKKCIQDCATTSEYDPVCGSNNITYFNPAKFTCAQNCGESVVLKQKGRCGDASPSNIAKP